MPFGNRLTRSFFSGSDRDEEWTEETRYNTHVSSSSIVAQLVQVAHHPPGTVNPGLSEVSSMSRERFGCLFVFLLLLPATVINAYPNSDNILRSLFLLKEFSLSSNKVRRNLLFSVLTRQRCYELGVNARCVFTPSSY